MTQDTSYDFIAKLQFLTHQEGGRKSFASSGYSPHFKLLDRDTRTSAKQTFIGKNMVEPGEQINSEISMLGIHAFEGLLDIGTRFELLEGSRLIARGEIIKVTNERLKKR